MALIALVSAGNAPGVTTTAFALTLAWPGKAMLAECDPAGGHLLAGYFDGALPADRGLWHLALQIQQGGRREAADPLSRHVIPLDERRERLLLPGAPGPFLMDDFSAETWGELTDIFRTSPMDVLTDVGHVGADLPFPLVGAADLVVFVMRPTLAQVAAARPRIEALRRAFGDGVPLALCLIGRGRYQLADIGTSLGGFVAMVGLPADDRSARVLHQGAKSGRNFAAGALMRSAAGGAKEIRRVALRLPGVAQGSGSSMPGGSR